ncbi:MAG: leucine-rich repeat protein [Lachnospiraceae bacterium]|nr:leucine-rich repeat protein [Lachnospiraceae bacterium]
MMKEKTKRKRQLLRCLLAGVAVVVSAVLLPGNEAEAALTFKGETSCTWETVSGVVNGRGEKASVTIHSLAIDTQGSPCNPDGTFYPGAVVADTEVPRLKKGGMSMSIQGDVIRSLDFVGSEGYEVTAETRIEELTWYRSTAPVYTDGCEWEEYTAKDFAYSEDLSYRARIKVYAGKMRRYIESSTYYVNKDVPVYFSDNCRLYVDPDKTYISWEMVSKPVYDAVKQEYYAIFESNIFSGRETVQELSSTSTAIGTLADLKIPDGTCSSAYYGDPITNLTFKTTHGAVRVDDSYSAGGFYEYDAEKDIWRKCGEGETFKKSTWYRYKVKLAPVSREYRIKAGISGYRLVMWDKYDADRVESFAREWTEEGSGVYVSPIFTTSGNKNPWRDENGNELKEINVVDQIPDEGLRRALLSEGAIWSMDGTLKKENAEKVTSLNLKDTGWVDITSFDGLKYFPALTKLNIDTVEQKIPTLDVRDCLNLSSLTLTKNANIGWIYPNENLLSLNISYNPYIHGVEFIKAWNLREICCQETNLTSLKLGGLEDLRSLRCNDCPLTEIKLSNEANLNELYCYNCHELKTLALSNIQSLNKLHCYNCSELTEINLMNVCELYNLRIYDNVKLKNVWLNKAAIRYNGELNIKNNPSLQFIVMENTEIGYWNKLNFSGNNLKTLDLSTAKPSAMASGIRIDTEGNSGMSQFKLSDAFAGLQEDGTVRSLSLNLSHCNLSSLTLPDDLYITELNCSNNQLTALDLSKLKTASAQLNCSNNRLTTLTLANYRGQQCFAGLNCSNNQLTSLFINVPGMFRTNAELICSGNPELKDVTLYDAALTLLDASNCPKLNLINLEYGKTNYRENVSSYCAQLNVNKTAIAGPTAIDSGDVSKVKKLDIGSNNLTALDVAAYTNLSELNCSNNQLTSLDLEGLDKLSILDCSGNALSKLDLSGNTNIYKLNCSRNKLVGLDLSALKSLKSKDVACDTQTPDTITAVNWIVNLKRIDEDFDPNKAQDTSGSTILQNSTMTAGGFQLPENTATLSYSYDVALSGAKVRMPVTMSVENSTGGKVYLNVNSKNATFYNWFPERGKNIAVRDVDDAGKIISAKRIDDLEEEETALPTPGWFYHNFVGWYTDKTGGEEKTIDDIYEGETVLFAHWENPHHLVYVEPKEATCAAPGNIGYYVCKDGGDSCNMWFADAEANVYARYSDINVLKKDHDTKNGSLIEVAASEPTCEKDGYEAHYVCKYCGRCFKNFNGTEEKTLEEFTSEKLGHDWGEWTVVKAATEAEEGVERRVCKREGCGQFEEQSIPKLEHEHSLTHVEAVEATCVAYGVGAHYECKKCGEWFEDAEGNIPIAEKGTYLLAMNDHTWEVTEQKPTETEDGWRKRTCTVCGQEEGIVLPKTNHEHQLVEVPAAEPTCSKEGGKLHYRCTVEGCELLFEDAEGTKAVTPGEVQLPKKEHDYELFERTEYCEQTGYEKHYVCKNCGQWFDEMKQEVVEANLVIPAQGHNWGPWTETTAATEETEGEVTRQCLRDSSHVQTQKTPKLNGMKVGEVVETENFTYKVSSISPVTLILTGYKNPGGKDVFLQDTVLYRDLECRVTDIAEDVFFDAKGIENLTIAGGINIGSGSFAYCTDLKSVKILAGEESAIGAGAFEGCTSLESIIVEEGVTTIGQGAFKGCKALTTVILPGSIKSIASDTFEEDLTLAIYSDSAAVISYAASHGYGAQQHEHSWSKSWSSDETGHWHVCLTDGCDLVLHSEMNAYAQHSFPDEWTVRRKATEEKEGLEYRKCSICRYEETRSIPKVVPKYYAITASAGQGGSISLTGTKAADGKFKEHTTATAKAAAAQGYRFVKWTMGGKDVSTAAEYTFTISGDAEITAVFAAETGTGTGSAPAGGNVTSGGSTSAGGTGDNPASGDGSSSDADGKQESGQAKAKVGDTFSVGYAQYKITGVSAGKLTVTYVKNNKKKAKTVTVPKTVSYEGMTYKVTEIAGNAFAKNTAVTSVTVGANVEKIGKSAFSGCKKLKKLTIKTKVLTSVGKNALKGIHKNCVIKVPKTKVKDYTKLFKKKGQPASVKIKK